MHGEAVSRRNRRTFLDPGIQGLGEGQFPGGVPGLPTLSFGWSDRRLQQLKPNKVDSASIAALPGAPLDGSDKGAMDLAERIARPTVTVTLGATALNLCSIK